ncbi:MAG TPA: cytochrome C, partial [Alphaproteobacteria bacterium]
MPQGSRLSASLMSAAFCLAVPAAAPAQQGGLPEGPGRELVQGACLGCHDARQILRSSGYTREGWQELIGTMIDLSASPQDRDGITRYLAAHFPPNTRRAAKPVPGPLTVAFREWVTPTLGQRSRDPVEAPDGSIWWAGQWADLVGRIDPGTGAMREFPLPAKSKPHTVTADAAGNVWYTGNGNGTLGRLDPGTGEVEVFRMPDPAARDPHSMIFDAAGTGWFTFQRGNMVGRIVPATGEIGLATMPVKGARPYGIKLDKDGVPWV